MTNLIKPNNFTPAQIVSYGQEAAKTLKEIVTKAGWVVKIQKNDYLTFEAWQTLARFYGLSAKTVSTNHVQYGEAEGFEAKADVIDKEGKVIGSAEALCLNDEKNWRGKPLYALKSMAQTRACAKALRQILSWVVVLAGYKPAPAEEMSEEIIKEPETQSLPSVKCKTCGNYLTPGEWDFNENYRLPKKLPYQCYSCSKKETEAVKAKVAEKS